MNSLYFKIGFWLVVFSIASVGLYKWHWQPLSQLQTQLKESQDELKEVGQLLNTCEANLTKQSLDGFIDGVGQDDEIPVIDLTNLHT